MKNLKLNLFLKEVFLFALTVTLGIFTAYRYIADSVGQVVFDKLPRFGWGDAIAVVIVMGLFVLAYRKKRVANVFFKIFLFLVVFLGANVFLASFLDEILSLSVAFFLAASFSFFGNIIFHNLGIVLSLAGLSAILGLSFAPPYVMLALVVLSFYDIIAVYKTKHMVGLARRMIESRAIFGFVIPFSVRGFFSKRSEVERGLGTQFMILGSGDSALPTVFVCSLVAYQSLAVAVWVGVFSILGLFLTHLLFTQQERRQPMAALPPIATMAILGYLISIFVI